MNSHFKIRSSLVAIGLGAAASLAAAQSGPMNFFALSLHEQLDASGQPGPVLGFAYTQTDGQSTALLGRSIIIMLDSDAPSRDGLQGLQAMGSAQPGRTQQGLHPFSDITPKEDSLAIVPLPSAALAGFGLFAGIAGVRLLRKIRN